MAKDALHDFEFDSLLQEQRGGRVPEVVQPDVARDGLHLAFVPLTSAPIYCAAKAAIHSYTSSLRFQLQDTGVHVVELMPPAVKTELTADLSEGNGFKLVTPDELVAATFKALEAGRVEIRPGQANQLHWLSRLAPGFINGMLHKASRPLIPAG